MDNMEMQIQERMNEEAMWQHEAIIEEEEAEKRWLNRHNGVF